LLVEVLSNLRTDNAQSDRAIKQGRLAASQKKEVKDGKKADRDELDK
jgi:hypothetical protein